MTTTTALVLNEIGGPFSLDTVDVHAIQPDEALVEICATGICHTDLSCADGTLPASAPAVLGHEGSAVVREVGAAVTDLAPGDKVLLSFASCEACDQCTAGHPAYCYSFVPLNFGGRRLDGSSTNSSRGPVFSRFFGQSSFARRTAVHRSTLVKVDPGTDLALFAPLGCGLQTGAGAIINTLDVQPGSTVAVFGVGSVGMSAVMAARLRGAREIIAVDLQQSRLDLAVELGAMHGILGGDPELVSKVRAIAPPNGVNYAVDCSGVPAVVERMIDCLGTRGRAATVGAPAPGTKAGIDIFAHLVGGKQYVGCCEGDAVASKMIPFLIAEHDKGKYPIERIITYYDIKDFDQAIKDTKEGRTLKAVLKW